MKETLYFVTLNWNTTDLLKEMVDSVEAATPEPHRWIIVDNGSSIEEWNELLNYVRVSPNREEGWYKCASIERGGITYEIYGHEWEKGFILTSPINLGCIVGHNLAFLTARILSEYEPHEIVMIDTDVVITEEGWLGRALAWAEEHPQAGVVGMEHARDQVCAPAVFLDPAGYWYIHEEQAMEPCPVEAESVGLGLALIRWSVLEAGLRFDTAFRMYYKQDDDFTFQVRAGLGLEIWAFPVGCVHYGAGSLRANQWEVGRWKGQEAVNSDMKWNNQRHFARKWAWLLRPRRGSMEEEGRHLAEMKRVMREAGTNGIIYNNPI